ncbi:hypothetical protein NDK43_03680 [Neobacillus pocheonensis]|uniref:Uncharacterized protein n=1 Tax=Neobacillus pocheonensis TaxID=363869 RepID=A0ABT0W813_9BACI|nr:hypothetical protein [Neobacillus pocheonensis]
MAGRRVSKRRKANYTNIHGAAVYKSSLHVLIEQINKSKNKRGNKGHDLAI